jgi:hypothetical protein
LAKSAARIPGDIDMPDIVLTPDASPIPILVRELFPSAIFAGLILSAEERATSLISGMHVYEFVHDGRHLLAFPCH